MNTTIGGTAYDSGRIDLRHRYHAPSRRRATASDLRGAEGTIVGVLIGLNVWIWLYVIVRACL